MAAEPTSAFGEILRENLQEKLENSTKNASPQDDVAVKTDVAAENVSEDSGMEGSSEPADDPVEKTAAAGEDLSGDVGGEAAEDADTKISLDDIE
jgi:hypothetical protein